jgi:hypothetical protein
VERSPWYLDLSASSINWEGEESLQKGFQNRR